jgi:hypothetical protein
MPIPNYEELIASGHRGCDGGHAGNSAGCLTTLGPIPGGFFLPSEQFSGRDGTERDLASGWIRPADRNYAATSPAWRSWRGCTPLPPVCCSTIDRMPA